jgi:hypothetical protein
LNLYLRKGKKMLKCSSYIHRIHRQKPYRFSHALKTSSCGSKMPKCTSCNSLHVQSA